MTAMGVLTVADILLILHAAGDAGSCPGGGCALRPDHEFKYGVSPPHFVDVRFGNERTTLARVLHYGPIKTACCVIY